MTRETVEVERSWVVASVGSMDRGKECPTISEALHEAAKLLEDADTWAVQITPRERIIR